METNRFAEFPCFRLKILQTNTKQAGSKKKNWAPRISIKTQLIVSVLIVIEQCIYNGKQNNRHCIK